MKEILILGATSYVGEQCALHLKKKGFPTYVYARRGTNRFLLRELASGIVQSEGVERLRGAQAVVNFGYVKGYNSYHEALAKSKAFARQLVDLTNRVRPGLVVQISSQAVFGKQRAFSPAQVTRLTGDDYADGKLVVEQILEEHARVSGIPLVTVRLGNVMGEHAPNWTESIADRILDLSTFARRGGWGFSNVTYIGNIIDYIESLVSASVSDLQSFGVYHHLAEFSSVSWDKWVLPMAAALGVGAEYLEDTESLPGHPARDRNFQSTLLHWARSNRIKPVLKRQVARLERVPLLRTRMESVRKKLPYTMSLFRADLDADHNFRNYMSAAEEFESHVIPGWIPPCDFGQALQRILSSLHDC